MGELKINLYELNIEGELSTILEIDEDTLPDDLLGGFPHCEAFNLAMIDVSGSMQSYWKILMSSWNQYISPVLKGHTEIYVFGNSVYFLRAGVNLETDDFKSECTNLTDAIRKIQSCIDACKQKSVRLILITDGHHNATDDSPGEAINRLSVPAGKTVEVYLLGVGSNFPVEYSITMRSTLHNGNSSIPSLFWADINAENYSSSMDYMQIIDSSIESEVISISKYLSRKNVTFKVRPFGQLAPHFSETNLAHPSEYIYFSKSAKDVTSSLTLFTENGEKVPIEIINKIISIKDLLSKVFCQWNSLIVQQHRRTGAVSPITFEIIEKIFKTFYQDCLKELEVIENRHSIKYRLAKKNVKFMEVEFNTLMNQSKKIIGLEEKFGSEIELAKGILKTTVKSKYDTKILKMRGHATEDYSKDVKDFIEIYKKIKDSIMALPEPSVDECCNVTMASTVRDLQDPSFLDLLQEDKFTFMKTFTVTGIPIYAPVKDASQINPWTLCIKNILKSPYAMLSQSTLELSVESGKMTSESNKEVYLQEGDKSSRFNAIVPVYQEKVVKVINLLLRTNIFAMLNTFCILKNPHVIDFDVHLAALGCTWMKSVSEHPIKNRPVYVSNRIVCIESSAKLYLGRPSIKKYLKILQEEPNEALMTESSKLYEEKSIKCESLVKPLFLLYMSRDKENANANLQKTFLLLIMEFIGRCLSTFHQSSAIEYPYSHFFVPELSSEDKLEKWFKGKLEVTSDEIMSLFIKEKGNLLQSYFKLEDLSKALKEFCIKQLKKREENTYEFGVNIAEIEKLSNVGSAGNIRLDDLKKTCEEMKLSEAIIQDLFNQENLFVYVFHCLQNKSSKDRLRKELPTYEESLKKVKILVGSENNSRFRIAAMEKIMNKAEESWRNEFLSIHENEVVQPMSRTEILSRASERDVRVTGQEFDEVFRYNPRTGLLRNACMIKSCPFYLKPNRSFNQHISIERKEGFLHQLHKTSLEIAKSNGTASDVINGIVNGGYKSQNGLKVPTIPSTDSLVSFEDRIEVLIKEYDSLLQNGEILKEEDKNEEKCRK